MVLSYARSKAPGGECWQRILSTTNVESARQRGSRRHPRQRTAAQFSVPFLGSIELDPDIRKGGDSGQPIVLEGDQSPHAKSMFAFTHRVIERTKEVQASAGGSVIQIT